MQGGINRPWAIEPYELHRVDPPLTDESGTENSTEDEPQPGVKRL